MGKMVKVKKWVDGYTKKDGSEVRGYYRKTTIEIPQSKKDMIRSKKTTDS